MLILRLCPQRFQQLDGDAQVNQGISHFQVGYLAGDPWGWQGHPQVIFKSYVQHVGYFIISQDWRGCWRVLFQVGRTRCVIFPHIFCITSPFFLCHFVTVHWVLYMFVQCRAQWEEALPTEPTEIHRKELSQEVFFFGPNPLIAVSPHSPGWCPHDLFF